MRFHQAGIESYPLQVYAAALIFSPSESPIRQIFQNEEPHDIVIKPVIEKYWSSLVQTFEDHDDRVVAMASSSGTDRITVASAAQDGTIKVWEATDSLSNTTHVLLHFWSASSTLSPTLSPECESEYILSCEYSLAIVLQIRDFCLTGSHLQMLLHILLLGTKFMIPVEKKYYYEVLPSPCITGLYDSYFNI